MKLSQIGSTVSAMQFAQGQTPAKTFGRKVAAVSSTAVGASEQEVASEDATEGAEEGVAAATQNKLNITA